MARKRINRQRNTKSKLLREFFKIDPEFQTEYNWALCQFQTAKEFTTLVNTVHEFKTLLKFDTRTPVINVFKLQRIRSFFFSHIRRTKRHFAREEQKAIKNIIGVNLENIREECINFIQDIFEWSLQSEKENKEIN